MKPELVKALVKLRDMGDVALVKLTPQLKELVATGHASVHASVDKKRRWVGITSKGQVYLHDRVGKL